MQLGDSEVAAVRASVGEPGEAGQHRAKDRAARDREAPGAVLIGQSLTRGS